MVEHFHALAILYDSGFFEHRSHMVAQDGLNGGNVSGLEDVSVAAVASREKHETKKGS
jgi:hypothetical protein